MASRISIKCSNSISVIWGFEQRARILLDTAAGVTLISKELATTLGARRLPKLPIGIEGVGESDTLYSIKLTLFGDECVGKDDERVDIVAHVMETMPKPSGSVDVPTVHAMPFLKDLPLADPTYHSGAAIDIILDTASFYTCRLGESRSSSVRSLMADKTIFGWIVEGGHLSKGLSGAVHSLQHATESPRKKMTFRLFCKSNG